jgi:hypothetical protein
MQWLLIPSNAVRRLTQTWRTGYCHYLALWLILAGYSLPGTAQHLESAGLSSSLNVTQTLARPYLVDMGSYVLDTNGDNSRYDEIGYRLAAYARWQVGANRFFAQLEVAYTSTRGQAYLVLYASTAGKWPPWAACTQAGTPISWPGQSSLLISEKRRYPCAKATRPQMPFTTACLRAYYLCSCWRRPAWASPSAASI